MIVGIGVDLCKIQRVREAIERTGDAFLEKLFTKKERDLATKTSNISVYFAIRFAAKEAILKAFQVGLSKYKPTDIEIGVGVLGEPVVILLGELAEFAAKRGVKEVFITMSYDGDYAIATSILES